MNVSVVKGMLLQLAAFVYKWMSGEEVLPLNMADDSVDDSFEGCRDSMHALVLSNYTDYEKEHTPGFKAAWENALNNDAKDELNINQSAAIYLYTENCYVNIDCSFKEFNTATRKGKGAYKSDHFQFYTLFFYLTDAVQQLNLRHKKCVTTYRKTDKTFETDVFNKTIRFGSFTSSSLDLNITGFGEDSCFNITTCLGAEVYNYSRYHIEKEVLIPPYEVFRVTAVKNKHEQKDLWCNVVYELEHAGNKSDLRCSKVIGRPSVLRPHLSETSFGK
ncbi:NAD(P)(+)--arginine ADP-ribosyltransferase 2-like [Salminus brasiliensis]|uniref:NAD(P)(+)--arginine ADP-ribosyltransferase 2-like n=1 Tax=Salminus brasiliensis TaxID=930266 RepID=UPI003B82FA6D